MKLGPSQTRLGQASRRGFLKGIMGASALTGIGTTSAIFGAFAARGARADGSLDYGPLVAVDDDATGLPLLKLPEGFRYISYGWAGDAMKDGRPTPGRHDGMSVVAQRGNNLILVRNHEQDEIAPAFGKKAITYDSMAAGGTSNLMFNTADGQFVKSWASLSGTVDNCAGGATPWETWISCEETTDGIAEGYLKDHGWVFEVPAEGLANPEPIKAMGRFEHEAIAVDPDSGAIYQTEDATPAGFYRYLPNVFGQPHQGGELQMLKIMGEFQSDLTGQVIDIPIGTTYDAEWVPIEDPESLSPSVYEQGSAQGGTRFVRLEGCWHESGSIYFTSTNGGLAKFGQVWRYDIAFETLTLVYVSPAKVVLDRPDNITVHPNRGIILCEDGSTNGQRMHFLTPSGEIFVFAVNNIELSNFKGFDGSYRGEEWAGACFSPDGNWLFANIQTPGVTFAITGPWKDYQINV